MTHRSILDVTLPYALQNMPHLWFHDPVVDMHTVTFGSDDATPAHLGQVLRHDGLGHVQLFLDVGDRCGIDFKDLDDLQPLRMAEQSDGVGGPGEGGWVDSSKEGLI